MSVQAGCLLRRQMIIFAPACRLTNNKQEKMSKTTRQALYERLRKTQLQEMSATCTREEIPLVRQQARRIGWRMTIPRGQRGSAITFEVVKQ